MSARKSSHRTIFLIVSSGSPLALIASSLRSTSKKPVCPMTRSFHPPMAHCNQRVRFAATWREEFFGVPFRKSDALHLEVCPRCAPVSQQQHRVLREVFRFDRLQTREPAADVPELASPAGVSERTDAPLVYGSAASAASSHRRPQGARTRR